MKSVEACEESLRSATLNDIQDLQHLIQISARALGERYYSSAQIEAALQGAWGVDTQLIRDGTFFVIEVDRRLLACGGWSFRRTLFGGDSQPGREPVVLDPRTEPARVRAFFVHPDFARRGLASKILAHCESAARQASFNSAELVATLPGVPLYASCGYIEVERRNHRLRGDIEIEFVTMRKHPLQPLLSS